MPVCVLSKPGKMYFCSLVRTKITKITKLQTWTHLFTPPQGLVHMPGIGSVYDKREFCLRHKSSVHHKSFYNLWAEELAVALQNKRVSWTLLAFVVVLNSIMLIWPANYFGFFDKWMHSHEQQTTHNTLLFNSPNNTFGSLIAISVF